MNIAAQLCALITARLDGVDHEGLRIYTYGARPGDIEQMPPPRETIVAVVGPDRLRWFEVTVREHGPNWAATEHDPEIRAELLRRTGPSATELP